MKTTTARYFANCFSCPDMFDIPNDNTIFEDKAATGFGGAQNMEEMMA